MADERWDIASDVVVIGSGAAGLAAAVSASCAGAGVLVVERSDKLGGTSAVSGGLPWIPNNHHMHEVGGTDSRVQALEYLESLSLGKMDEGLAETYVDTAPEVIRFLEQETELRFQALRIPDYQAEHPGAAIGRSLTAGLFPARGLGSMRPKLRMSAHYPIPVSLTEIDDFSFNAIDPEAIAQRLAEDLVGTGHALVAGLIKAAIQRGVEFRLATRVRHLKIEDGRVIGVVANSGDGDIAIGARKGVVIASGGFEWNSALLRDYVYGPQAVAASPPFNEGDGLLMAQEAGAALANMGEAWWQSCVSIPNEEYEGRPLHRLSAPERHSPGSIVVNKYGRRFTDESVSYHDFGHAMRAFDPVKFEFPNAPAWVIVDSRYLERYPFATRFPGDPIPNWLICAATPGELATKISVDPDTLTQTIERFNIHARRGEDPDFGRGIGAYGRYYGDRSFTGAFQTLGALEQPPYYACQLQLGMIGTRGGPKTDSNAQVLRPNGEPITKLYAAGNAAANFMGMAYPGAGSTIGTALTFGFLAGRHAAQRND